MRTDDQEPMRWAAHNASEANVRSMLLAKCNEVASLKSRLEKAEKVCEFAQKNFNTYDAHKDSLRIALEAWAEEAGR